MVCYHPVHGYRAPNGQIVSSPTRGYVDRPAVRRCRNCIGCRYDRASEWATRIMHEAQLHPFNSFITLTYSPEHLPADKSLDYTHFQKFMKRLRKWHRKKIRFYMCGEYGSQLGRPHYHAIIFGLQFPDLRKHKFDKKTGETLFTSAVLTQLWPYGFSSIGSVTYASAGYVARYVVDKINGDLADDHYFNPETGSWRTPEFNNMSLKPGIAAGWFEKYGETDVFPHDHVIVKGRKAPVPKYYNTLYERAHEDVYKSIKIKRALDRAKRTNHPDNTPERLAVKKQVFQAKVRNLKRSLT